MVTFTKAQAVSAFMKQGFLSNCEDENADFGFGGNFSEKKGQELACRNRKITN